MYLGQKKSKHEQSLCCIIFEKVRKRLHYSIIAFQTKHPRQLSAVLWELGKLRYVWMQCILKHIGNNIKP